MKGVISMDWRTLKIRVCGPQNRILETEKIMDTIDVMGIRLLAKKEF